MSRPQVPATTAALQKSFVTYTMPVTALNAATITTLEARALLASTGITGLRTWEAALYLGSYLSTTEGTLLVQNKRIIELGAGTGFVSILCAKHLGANYVLATDGSGEVVDDMVSNVYLNGHEGNGIIDTAVLEWGHTLVGRIFESHSDTRTFDVALGADVVRSHSSLNMYIMVHYVEFFSCLSLYIPSGFENCGCQSERLSNLHLLIRIDLR